MEALFPHEKLWQQQKTYCYSLTGVHWLSIGDILMLQDTVHIRYFIDQRKATSSQSKYTVTNFAEVKRQFLDAVVETIEMEEACMSLTDTELGPYGYLDSSIFHLDHG